jgi:hypothetical protein
LRNSYSHITSICDLLNFYFGYNGGAETTLKLTCPFIMTPRESGSAVAAVTNKVERTISPIFQADISGELIRTIRTQPSVQPGETAKLTWDLSAADVVYGHLILVQVYQKPSFKTPTAADTCGTLFLDLPGLTGMQVYLLALAASLLCMAVGLALWLVGRRSLPQRTSAEQWGMVALSAFVLLGILFGSLELWILGVLALVLTLLMLVVMFGRRLTAS